MASDPLTTGRRLLEVIDGILSSFSLLRAFKGSVEVWRELRSAVTAEALRVLAPKVDRCVDEVSEELSRYEAEKRDLEATGQRTALESLGETVPSSSDARKARKRLLDARAAFEKSFGRQ